VLPIRAPAAGRVLRVLERNERVVAAATPLLELGDARTLEIVIDVLSSDAPRVRPGQRVRIERWGGDGALAGVVRTVEPAGFTRVSPLGVEEQRVNVIIDPIDPPPTLGDGYRVEGRIVIWEGARVLTVPPSALVRDASGWSVFVVEQGRARRRTVNVGHWSDAGVEILGGLAEGATVVAFPSDRVTDGVRVRSVP
jgi:HlyD family secretion protein